MQPPSESITGTFRRFGAVGTVYEVLGPHNGAFVKIRVLESDEEAIYPLSQALSDPKES